MRLAVYTVGVGLGAAIMWASHAGAQAELQGHVYGTGRQPVEKAEVSLPRAGLAYWAFLVQTAITAQASLDRQMNGADITSG